MSKLYSESTSVRRGHPLIRHAMTHRRTWTLSLCTNTNLTPFVSPRTNHNLLHLSVTNGLHSSLHISAFLCVDTSAHAADEEKLLNPHPNLLNDDFLVCFFWWITVYTQWKMTLRRGMRGHKYTLLHIVLGCQKKLEASTLHFYKCQTGTAIFFYIWQPCPFYLQNVVKSFTLHALWMIVNQLEAHAILNDSHFEKQVPVFESVL